MKKLEKLNKVITNIKYKAKSNQNYFKIKVQQLLENKTVPKLNSQLKEKVIKS